MYTKYKLYWTRAKLWSGSLGRDYMLMTAGQSLGSQRGLAPRSNHHLTQGGNPVFEGRMGAKQ
jgi:hypothetical protein